MVIADPMGGPALPMTRRLFQVCAALLLITPMDKVLRIRPCEEVRVWPIDSSAAIVDPPDHSGKKGSYVSYGASVAQRVPASAEAAAEAAAKAASATAVANHRPQYRHRARTCGVQRERHAPRSGSRR